MKISEAIRMAVEKSTCITRKGKEYKIKPTNTYDGCVIYSKTRRIATSWTPKQEDLLAEDWEVVD